MNADDLYQEIKAALEYFGLRFKEMHLVEVRFHDGEIEFSYGGRSTRVKVSENAA